MGTGPLAGQRAVVVGASGAVGSMFAELLKRLGAGVVCVDLFNRAQDSRPTERLDLCGDITSPDGQLRIELGRADIILLAIPEAVAVQAARPVITAMARGALLIQTLSVQTGFMREVEGVPADVEVVGINPMFAPALPAAGRPVAVVVIKDGSRVAQFLNALRMWGPRTVLLTSDEHDRLAAVTQALTHIAVLAAGLALCELGLDVERLGSIAPPPHATLLALLARMVSNCPDVYWDVQVANPHAEAARNALNHGLRHLSQIIEQRSETEFGTVLERIREFLAGDLARYRDTCTALFHEMVPPHRKAGL